MVVNFSICFHNPQKTHTGLESRQKSILCLCPSVCHKSVFCTPGRSLGITKNTKETKKNTETASCSQCADK